VRFFQRASKGKKGGKMIFEIIPKLREGGEEIISI